MSKIHRSNLVIDFCSRIPLRYRGTAVALIPVAGIVATLATWSWMREQAIIANQWISHTQMVIRESDRLLITSLNAETGVRGYGITGNKSFLGPYNRALQAFPQKYQRLSELVQDNPAQSQRLLTVRRLVNQQFELFERYISLRQQKNRSPQESDAQLSYQGKQLMDEVRTRLNEFQTVEQQLLEERQANLEEIREVIGGTVWTIGGLSILSSLIAMVMFNQIDWAIEEQALRLKQGRSLTRSLMTNVVDGVITVDPQGNIEAVNEAITKMFGYKAEMMTGKPIEFLFAALPHQPLPSEKGISVIKQQEQVGRRKDGTLFPMDISTSEIKISNQWLVIVHDITELKVAEAHLKTRAAELARLNLMLAKTNADLQNRNLELDQFAYVASHDLKAPLRAIANLSEWLEEDLKGELPEENQYQMKLLRGRVHRMDALINGLLQYSRVGRKEVPIEKVNVAALLGEVIDSLDLPPEFTIEVAPQMPILQAKRMLLDQVFSNLISNAVRHHPRNDGVVKIAVSDEGDRYRFSIIDNGSGIAPQFHSKIFTIFQTLEPRDKVESTGIGLAIVKKIVESEGGEICLKSNIGEGSTFEFTWIKQFETSS